MTVPMVQVWVMRVLVPHRRVPVPMGMRLGHRRVVAVLVMRIVDVSVFVLQRGVNMLVLVPLRQV